MDGNPDPPRVPPDKQSNSTDTANDVIYSEKIAEESPNGNKSNTGSVYAIHVTAEYEERKVWSQAVKKKKNGFFVNKSHDNLLLPTTDD